MAITKNGTRITRWINSKAVITTASGPMKAKEWCEAEAARLCAAGKKAEVQEAPNFGKPQFCVVLIFAGDKKK